MTISSLDFSYATARQHTWAEDGVNFTVIDNPHTPHLIGERFTGGMVTSNEAVLAREVLRLRAMETETLNQAEQITQRLIDSVNALERRIEEALDLLIHETERSRRVEQAYRLLEKMMMDGTKKGDSK